MVDEVTVRDNPDERRYEAWVGDDLAGFAAYDRVDGLIVFLHTQVEPAYEHHGVGSALVRQSLDDVRARELTVRPVCPFYRRFFDDHPEYADLLG